MKMFMGVVDVGYTDDNGATTTGDVAGYLEDRYHVMRTFVEIYGDKIHAAIVDEVSGAIESIAMGKRVPQLNLQPAGAKIEQMFRGFLDTGEMNALIGSYKVSDATLSKSSRRKSGKMPDGQQRQAFVDSGLYQASSRVWFGP